MRLPRFWKRRETEPPAPLADLRRQLSLLPQNPTSTAHPRHWLFRTKRALDFFGHARPGPARFFARVNPYPKPFVHTRFRTEDGVSIAGWYAPAPEGAAPRFGLVIVPGMFSTKDDTVHKRRTIQIWRHWKIPVLAIDMRAFGESTGIATAGWKEALDVHGAAAHLMEKSGVERIAVVAESMGGAAALNALAHDSETGANLLSGGVLTFSAFVDARDAVQYISTQPDAGNPFFVPYRGFRRLLRFKSRGRYDAFDSFLVDAARVNGLTSIDELLDLANPKWKVGMMHQPTLLVHSTNDPVVPVRHARRMERYARDMGHIQTLIVDWGGHTGFEPMDPWWFWEVMRRFFSHVNDVELPNIAEDLESPQP